MFWPIALSIEIGRLTRNLVVCADVVGAPIEHRTTTGKIALNRPTAPHTNRMAVPLGSVHPLGIGIIS
jgi:hypothetical protein